MNAAELMIDHLKHELRLAYQELEQVKVKAETIQTILSNLETVKANEDRKNKVDKA